MTTSEAIRIFLTQTGNLNGLPFRPISKLPNKQTVSAIKQAITKSAKIYDNPDDLFEDLGI